MLRRRRQLRKATRLARALVALDLAAAERRPAPRRRAVPASLALR